MVCFSRSLSSLLLTHHAALFMSHQPTPPSLAFATHSWLILFHSFSTFPIFVLITCRLFLTLTLPPRTPLPFFKTSRPPSCIHLTPFHAIPILPLPPGLQNAIAHRISFRPGSGIHCVLERIIIMLITALQDRHHLV